MTQKNIIVAVSIPAEQEFLQELLIAKGYCVTIVDDGKEVEAKSKQLEPHIILIDTVLPGLNGFQVIRLISHDEQTKHIPIILIGAGELANEKWGVRQGAAAVVTRPLDAQDLLEKIALLGNAGSNAGLMEYLQMAEQRLAYYIGPLAKILVNKAAQQTSSEVQLYQMLASNIPDENDQKEFLASLEKFAHQK